MMVKWVVYKDDTELGRVRPYSDVMAGLLHMWFLRDETEMPARIRGRRILSVDDENMCLGYLEATTAPFGGKEQTVVIKQEFAAPGDDLDDYPQWDEIDKNMKAKQLSDKEMREEYERLKEITQ